MSGAPETALARESSMAMQFRELDAVNTNIAQQAQFLIETQNKALAERIETARTRLMRLVVAASALAVSLALAFGVWLARPFKRLQRAIVGLGENRLDEPIDIHGPADVRRVSQQLEWLRLRLTELDADKARFLRHVSHELKTPLAALREGVSLLEDGVTGALNPAQREVAQILQQNTDLAAGPDRSAAALQRRGLRGARSCTANAPPLLPLIEDQIEAQRLQWQANGLTVRAEGEPISVVVDPVKLGTALANLLSNAIRYSARGGIITLAVSSTADTVAHRHQRRRPRHRGWRPRPHLRTLLSRRAATAAFGQGNRHRPLDRAGVHCSPWRPHHAAARRAGCAIPRRVAALRLKSTAHAPFPTHVFFDLSQIRPSP